MVSFARWLAYDEGDDKNKLPEIVEKAKKSSKDAIFKG